MEELNKWIIPRIELKTVYQLGTFEKLGLKQVVKTTRFNRSKISTRRIIKWDEIPMPQQWKLERTGHIQSKTEHNIDHIEQTPEGIVYIQMDNTPSRLGHIPKILFY